ncbi:MAG: 5-deoxy-glucuronate isomerase [Chitinophagaceae bacterium]|nr:MAG: 5-deoxy-glucuronate isomerase [Chitinophagaceae bacterium]
MQARKTYKLVKHPLRASGVYQKITTTDAGWTHLNFEARLMQKGKTWEGNTGEYEFAFILLSGNYSADTDKGNWKTENGRKNVFEGIAHSLYLPRHTSFKITAESEWLDIAAGWCIAHDDFPARFKRPEEAAIEVRGGDNATRQINSLVEPGFGCSRIIAVEVYTPSGNWSSFPAHKHDERKTDAQGNVIESNLEEIYFYKINKEQGYAIQQVYTSDGSLNELMQVKTNDAVLVPKGYHPVAAAHGYHCYYLNFLAGSDQSLANTPDPDHNWIFGSWKGTDPRIPMVNSSMNN